MGSNKRRKNATSAASSAVKPATKSRKKQKTTTKTKTTNSIDSPEIILSDSEVTSIEKEDSSNKKQKFERKKKFDDEIHSEDSSFQLASLPDFSFITRLSTFKNGVTIQKKSASKKKTTTCHFNWTKETPSCEELAKNGFFFTPSDKFPDCITCIYCNENIHDPDSKQNNNPEIMDDETIESLILKHFKTSTNCSFSKLLVTKFLKTHSISFDWESYPILNNPFSKDSINIRLDTFKRFNWPYDSDTNNNNLPKSDKLAKAGFYYDPHKSILSNNNRPDDTVTCVYCNVSLQDWEEDDNPMVEHKNISPNCYLCQYDTKNKMKNRIHNSNKKSISPGNSRRNSLKRKSIVLSNKRNSTYVFSNLPKDLGSNTYTNRRRSSIMSISDIDTDKEENKEPFSDEVIELSENDININKIHSGMDLIDDIQNNTENKHAMDSNNENDKESNEIKEVTEHEKEKKQGKKDENNYESILNDISIDDDVPSDPNVDNNQGIINNDSDNDETVNLRNANIRSDPLQEEIVDIDSIEDEIEKENNTNVKNSRSSTNSNNNNNNNQATRNNTPDVSSLNIPTKTLSDLNDLWFIEDNSSSRPATMFSSGKARLSMYDIKSSKLEISKIPAKVRSSLRPTIRTSSPLNFNNRKTMIDVSQSLAASSPIKTRAVEDSTSQFNVVEPIEQVEQEQPVEQKQVSADDYCGKQMEIGNNVDDIEEFQYDDDVVEDHKDLSLPGTPDPFTKINEDDNNNHVDIDNDAYDMNVDYGIVDNDPIDDDSNNNENIELEEILGLTEAKTNVEIEEAPKPRKRGRPPKKKRGKSKSDSEETENKIKEIAYNEKVIEEDIIPADISTLVTKTEDKNEITEVSVHESAVAFPKIDHPKIDHPEIDHPEKIEIKELETADVNPDSDKVQESSSDSFDISNSDTHDITSSHDSSSSFITQGNKKIINAKYVSKIVKRGRKLKNTRRILVNGQIVGSDDLLNPSSSSNTPSSFKPIIKNKKLKLKEKSQSNVNILTKADHGNTDSGSLLGSNNLKDIGTSKMNTNVNNSDKENNVDLYNRDSRSMVTEINNENERDENAQSVPGLAVNTKSSNDKKLVNSDDDILLEDEYDDEIDSHVNIGGTKLRVDKQVYSDAKTLSPVGIKSFSKFSSRSGSQKSTSGDEYDDAKVLDLKSFKTGCNNPVQEEVLDNIETKLPSDEFVDDSEVSVDDQKLEISDDHGNELTIKETINKEIQNRKRAINSLTPIKFDPSSSPYAEEKVQGEEIKTIKNIKTDDRSPSVTAAGLFSVSENGNIGNKVKLFPSSPDIIRNTNVPSEFGEESSRLVKDRESSSSFDPTTKLDLKVYKPEENNKSNGGKLLWESPNYEEVSEQVGQLTVATQFFKEIANSEYNSLNDDLDGMLTNFISEMPKQELEMTIQEWIKYSAKQAGKIVEEKCENMINRLKIEQDKALEILNHLPVSDSL